MSTRYTRLASGSKAGTCANEMDWIICPASACSKRHQRRALEMTTGRVWESQVIDVREERGIYKSRKWKVRGTSDRSLCYSLFLSSLIEARKKERRVQERKVGIMAAPEYPKTPLNKLGRLPARGKYDFPTIHGLVNSCPVLHVSFNDPEQDFPVVLPMLGCTGNFEDQTADPHTTAQDIYIHGYVSARLFRQDTNSTTTPGLPITISATFLDGLVLSLTPFHNSCNYRSALVYGRAALVTDPAEALYAMKLITDNMLPGRWEKSRVPPTDVELKSTGILRVRVEAGSAKVRVGGPSEDRKDLDSGELRGNVWTGVVPYWGTWGEPVEGKENGRSEVEGYIEQWRQKETAKARGYAFDAIEMEGKKK
ncbi:hypothetical protein HBH46_167580 [Parastagonospora nodorum]|nr:hypothetical protein HBH46_167580 [Parastagonospora nodorum]KAH5299403.1 hypothetical protein HBI11_151510 [Parastagonospora nodorum]